MARLQFWLQVLCERGNSPRNASKGKAQSRASASLSLTHNLAREVAPAGALAATYPIRPNEDDYTTWDFDRVAEWVQTWAGRDSAIRFKRARVDGEVLSQLSERDLKEDLAMSLGDRRRFQLRLQALQIRLELSAAT
ncbi:hypothetical protein CYMTET_3060 [Cymbomonas tetramitiformis]|uniref:SAM domain-containing protein n=1 Tax=Cymbomonas tetramitiformis TaxID=36881 RepID=A0AAE0H431_9CHLO|nr:hypothetical protein CYMTET_3060 [Cymbomonas tetramitiformis]